MCLWMSYMWSEAKTWHLLAGNPVDSSLSILLPPTLYIPSQLLRKCSVWLSWHDWQIMTCSSRCTFRDHTSWSRRRDKAAANLLLVTCQKLQQQRNGVAGYDLFTHNGHFWMNCFFFFDCLLHCLTVTIITRTQWGAAEPKGREKLKSPAGRAIVHHTALPGCSSLDQSKKLVQSIQRGHMNDRGFDDIGYKLVTTLTLHRC